MNDFEQLMNDLRRSADEYGACGMLRGDESLQQLVKLLFSPAGRKFCFGHSFPRMEIFRRFLRYQPSRLGVFIDSGAITIYDTDVFLVGNTRAKIHCEALKSHHIYLMHGAQAYVIASGYAVVCVKSDKVSKFASEVRDEAKIIN